MEITFFIPLVPLFVASMHFLFFSRTEWRRRVQEEKERQAGWKKSLGGTLCEGDASWAAELKSERRKMYKCKVFVFSET